MQRGLTHTDGMDQWTDPVMAIAVAWEWDMVDQEEEICIEEVVE